MRKHLFLILFFALLDQTSKASRIEQITSTLTNNAICNSLNSFTIYGPSNGIYRWQTATDTTLSPEILIEYNSQLYTDQSDSIRYYRRISYNYADTSNWLRIIYIGKPIITSPTSYSICTGNATQINLTANVPSTMSFYTANNNGSISGASSGTGNTINQTLTNPSNNYNASIYYLVTPTSTIGGCLGYTQSILVNVLPKAQITNLATASVCSKQVLNYPLTANVPANFTWKVASVSGGVKGASDSSGNTLIQELVNPSNSINGVVNYKLHAKSITGNCPSDTVNFALTVKPLPVILTLLSDTICSGGVNEQIFMNNSIYSNLSWTLTKQLGPTGASSGSGTVMRQSITNTSNYLYGLVEFSIKLTSVLGGCANADTQIAIYVAPVPGILPSTSKTICSGSNTDFIPNTAYPGKFIWTLGNQSAKISGASAALQQKTGIFQQLVNTGSAIDSQIYLVKHVLTEISCASAPTPITIKVSNEPTPILDSTNKIAEICSDVIFQKSFNYVPASNIQIAQLYKPLNLTGSPNAIENTFAIQLNSKDTSPAIAKYKIFPITTSGQCMGNADTFRIIVNPLENPNFSAAINQRKVSFLSVNKGAIHTWYFGDGDSSNLQDPQHIYTADGNYTVKHIVKNNWSCQADSSKTISIQSTGILENLTHTFHIYPNPAVNKFTLESPIKSAQIQISIYNLQGQLCSHFFVFGSNQYQIETSNLAEGLYWVKIENEEKSELHKLLIKTQ